VKRIGALAAVAALVVLGFASPAHAAAQNKIWVEGGFLKYEHMATAPAAHLVVRTAGDTFIVEDSYGLMSALAG
jgi:hypothetical protein